MKKNEIIELNGVEYTVELNRNSAVQIEKYTNLKEAMAQIKQPLMDYVDEIKEDEDPFENLVDIEEMQEKAKEKENALHKIIERAFWVWLYPNHKLNIEKVKEILKPYLDDTEKLSFITDKFSTYLQMSTEINEQYIQEQKNLKAQINK